MCAPGHLPLYIWALVSAHLTGWVTGCTLFQCLVVAYCFFPFLFILNNAVFSFMYIFIL